MNQPASQKLIYLILAVCLSLSLIGLVLNYSIRPQLAYSQAIALIIGLGIFWLFSQPPFQYLLNLSLLIHIGVIILLGAVLFAEPIRGASRWLTLFEFHLQPSEVLKLSLVLFTWRLVWFNQLKKDLKTTGLISIWLGVPLGLIILEPDLGTFALILGGLTLSLAPFFLSLKRVIVITSILALSLPFIWYQLKPYQQQRLSAFIDPFKDPLKSGYNIIQARLTIQNGGLTGQLNPSKQYQANLPEAQTDFIFAVWVEDTGAIGGTLLILTYLGLAFLFIFSGRYLKAAETIPLSLITFFICFQAFIHIAINLGLLPVTGTTLPFISYGRSALIVNFALLGLLANRLKSQPIPFIPKPDNSVRRLSQPVSKLRPI